MPRVLALIAVLATAAAFAPPQRRAAARPLRASADEPIIPVEIEKPRAVEPVEPAEPPVEEAVAAKVESFADLVARDMRGGPRRVDVVEKLLELEKSVPATANLTDSLLLNGMWEMVYASSWSSPGLLAYQLLKKLPVVGRLVELDSVTISIRRSAPRVEATTAVRLGGTSVPVRIVTDIVAASGSRLIETVQEAYVGDMKLPIERLASKATSRDMFVTYLDDDVLVVRDKSGLPEILRRKEFAGRDSYTGEPSFADDDLSPGAG